MNLLVVAVEEADGDLRSLINLFVSMFERKAPPPNTPSGPVAPRSTRASMSVSALA